MELLTFEWRLFGLFVEWNNSRDIPSVHLVPLSGTKMRAFKLKIQKACLVTKYKCVF